MNASDIMSMAGLDNEDVTLGYNNFKTMHKLVDNLAELAHCPKSERTKLLHDRINNISDWHKSNFMKHLGDDKDHCCQCLLCGFHCKIDPIPCSHRGNHKGPCRDCCNSFSIFDDLHELLQEARIKCTPDQERAVVVVAPDNVEVECVDCSTTIDDDVGSSQEVIDTNDIDSIISSSSDESTVVDGQEESGISLPQQRYVVIVVIVDLIF